LTVETVTLWTGRREYLVTKDKEWVDLLGWIDLLEQCRRANVELAEIVARETGFLETSRKNHAELMEKVSTLLQGLVVGEYDPADQDALIEAINARFVGSSSVSAYA
jgi:hypothetical protein